MASGIRARGLISSDIRTSCPFTDILNLIRYAAKFFSVSTANPLTSSQSL
jgi:hypothetical protein